MCWDSFRIPLEGRQQASVSRSHWARRRPIASPLSLPLDPPTQHPRHLQFDPLQYLAPVHHLPRRIHLTTTDFAIEGILELLHQVLVEAYCRFHRSWNQRARQMAYVSSFSANSFCYYFSEDFIQFFLLHDCTPELLLLHLHFLQHSSWYFAILWTFIVHGFAHCSCQYPFGGQLRSNLGESAFDSLQCLLHHPPDLLPLIPVLLGLLYHFSRRTPHYRTRRGHRPQQQPVTSASLLDDHLSKSRRLHLQSRLLRRLQSRQ